MQIDGGTTDMTKLIVAFLNFANATKNRRTFRYNSGIEEDLLEAKVHNGRIACVGKRIPIKS
jgi:hypothetical protein